MKLTFIGADHEVTGSCHYLQAAGKNILVDFGMQQGRDLYENIDLPIAAKDVDYVLITHAHLDHTGMLPFLYKQGFRGTVLTTKPTLDLCSIMLADSAHIQESDAEWKNRKRQRKGLEPIEPPYTMEDVNGLMTLFIGCDYDQKIDLCPGISIRFTDVGHLLGSSAIEVWATESGVSRKIVFSGDVGNTNQPLLRDPQPVEGGDYLLIESTYGDRIHEKPADYIQPLAEILERTFKAGGNLVIPSFAVGRTQEMLYYFREIKNRNLVPDFPDFKVYVDSPLAVEATKIFTRNQDSCFDQEASQLLSQGIDPIDFPGLCTAVTGDESKAINYNKDPKVIISASGMCDAGRIRHHLKYNLWRPESTILFVGYQAEGSLVRRLLDGAAAHEDFSVTLFGDEIAVKASICQLPGISGHADQKMLIDWVKSMKKQPSRIFVVHGEDKVTDLFAALLNDTFGKDDLAKAPYSGSVYDLVNGCWIYEAPPTPIEHRAAGTSAAVRTASLAYQRLVSAFGRLKNLVEKSSGWANKDLGKFTDDILSLVEKWK